VNKDIEVRGLLRDSGFECWRTSRSTSDPTSRSLNTLGNFHRSCVRSTSVASSSASGPMSNSARGNAAGCSNSSNLSCRRSSPARDGITEVPPGSVSFWPLSPAIPGRYARCSLRGRSDISKMSSLTAVSDCSERSEGAQDGPTRTLAGMAIARSYPRALTIGPPGVLTRDPAGLFLSEERAGRTPGPERELLSSR
jgi:hypothetical protein